MTSPQSVRAWLDENFARIVAERGVPGASVAVLTDGEVLTAAAGVTSLVTEIEVDTDTIFQIGSITKLWTSALVMQLVDDGLLDLDQPVRTYLPDFAIGDAPRVVSATGEWPTMQRAIECLWQAKLAARNILTLAAAPPDYPHGVPPLRPHTLREDFFHGISLGGESLVVYGKFVLDAARLNTWFRRFLMRQYFARYS